MSFPIRLPFRCYLVTSLLVALTILPTALVAQTLGDTPWNEYFGSSTGPHENWGYTRRIASHRTTRIKTALKAGDDIILGDTIGLSTAKKEAKVALFMDSIEADGGTAFREAVFNRAVKLDSVRLKVGTTDQVLYWMFGNEITSLPYVLNLRAWAEEPVQPAKHGDPWIIPYYVEYYLAPAVQAIREAEVATGVDIPVFLGSIGNASNPARRDFLYQVLNYVVAGTYADTLAGQRVADIVDHVGIHYTVAKNAHVKDEKGKYIKHLKGSFELALDEMYDPWVASGILDGLWATEEVGRKVGNKGYGAAKAMVVTSRYLHWWAKKDISPEQGRAVFFGTTIGPADVTANLAMQTLFGFLGATPLVEILDAVAPPADDWETYLFESVDNNNKRVAFIVPSWSDTVPDSFTEFEIDATLWPGSIAAEVVIYGLGATTVTNAIVDRQGDVLTVTVPAPIEAQADKPPSIVITLQRSD